MASATVEPERSFYHSFPRIRPSDTEASLRVKGLQLLRGIKDIGLVLAPEVVEWSVPKLDGTTQVIRNRQVRICFTELSQTELPEHATAFGPFSLEFPIHLLRQFGILPVIYVPQTVEGDRLLSSLGPVMVLMFENARHTLDKLDQLLKLSDPEYTLEFARKTNPGVTHVDPNYELNLQNNDEEKRIVKIFSVRASVVRGVLEYLNYRTAPFDLMRGAIWAAQNLFYPTDDQINNKLLSYYRQREWRIIPGVAVEGKAIARMTTADEKEFLLSLDRQFWSRELADDKGGFRRIDEAQVIDEFQGKHISECIQKVIMPPEAYNDAREIFGDAVMALPETS